MTAGARMLYEQTVKKFPAMMGRKPTAEDLAKIEFHANEFSKPMNQMSPAHAQELQRRLEATTPAKDKLVDPEGRAYLPVQSTNQSKGLITPEEAAGYTGDPFGTTPENFRVRNYETSPPQWNPETKRFERETTNEMAFDPRDPFLTEAMTGRSPSRTRQKPFTVSIDDLMQNKAALENQGVYGDVANVGPGDYPGQSTTPSADFFANMASKIEAAKLPTNIQSTLREQLGRQPTEDEVNAAIANLNVAGHDYTGKGAAIFAERPPTKRGTLTAAEKAKLAEWRQQAIDSGMSRTAVNASPSDLAAKFPGITAEQELGPALPFKHGGGVHPDDLRAEMIVHGYEPKKYAAGSWVMEHMAGPVGHVIVQGAPSVATHGAVLAPSIPDVRAAIQSAKAGKYGEALGNAGDIASAVLPWTPLTIGPQLAMYSPEVGDDTLKGYAQQEQIRNLQNMYNQNLKESRPIHHGRTPLEIAPGESGVANYQSDYTMPQQTKMKFQTEPLYKQSPLARKTGLE